MKSTYAFHCTSTDPKTIESEGWKVGPNGYTEDNMFEDLYFNYLPAVPVFVSDINAKVWDPSAKYCIKLDISGIEKFPDFGNLVESGAIYEDGYFYWKNEQSIKGSQALKKFIMNDLENMTLAEEDFTGDLSWELLGTCAVDGKKLNGRIVDFRTIKQ